MSFHSWMSQLNDDLKRVPIINLAIPGSHDSMSYTIKPSSAVAPDSDHIVQVLCRVLGKPSRKVVYRWCVTQELNILQQLRLGIRYFDLRISIKENDSELYFVHGLYGDEISKNLDSINDYLDQFTEEVVILDFQHFYGFSTETHDALMELIKSTFGEKLCPLTWDINTVTLSWMLDHGYRVIAVYRSGSAEKDDQFWPSVRWPTPWPETTSVSVMLQFLEKTLAHRPKNAGLVTQCVLTPDVKFVVRNLCGGLRARCSVPCFNAAIPWLQQQRPGVRGINVVITDFVNTDGEEFCRTVISLNDLLLKS